MAYDVIRENNEHGASSSSSFQTTAMPVYAAVKKKKKEEEDQLRPVPSGDGQYFSDVPGDRSAPDSTQQVSGLCFLSSGLHSRSRHKGRHCRPSQMTANADARQYPPSVLSPVHTSNDVEATLSKQQATFTKAESESDATSVLNRFLPLDAVRGLYMLRPGVRPSVRLSHAGVLSKRLKSSSCKQRRTIAQGR